MRFPFKGVIFDMDGLMLDTEPLYRSTMIQAAQELDYPFEEELYNRFIGCSVPTWRQVLTEIFGDDYPSFNNRRRHLWEQHVQTLGVVQKAGLSELLDQLDEDKLPRAIATSTWRADALLCLGPLAARFDTIVTGDEVQHSKPAPDIFLLAAERLNLAPTHCLALEDSETGAQAALAAGMSVIVVPDLQHPSAETIAKLHRVCTSLHEVRELFWAK